MTEAGADRERQESAEENISMQEWDEVTMKEAVAGRQRQEQARRGRSRQAEAEIGRREHKQAGMG